MAQEVDHGSQCLNEQIEIHAPAAEHISSPERSPDYEFSEAEHARFVRMYWWDEMIVKSYRYHGDDQYGAVHSSTVRRLECLADGRLMLILVGEYGSAVKYMRVPPAAEEAYKQHVALRAILE